MAKLYVGRTCDPQTLAPGTDNALIDTRNLVRHGVLLGMTGSGKTGLGVCLLEEVSMAGVPIVAVDPKGDLTNLALAFPELRPTDFEPWIDPAEARRKNVDVPTRAAQVAEDWREGHESWAVGDDRRRAFADADVTVYTPGSTSGVPVDVLASLRAPSSDLRDDSEGLTDLASGTVTALLGLVGVTADPFRDPEAIVLTQIVHDAWSQGQDLTVERLLTRLMDPPFDKIGVFPVDQFFPRKKRTDLAMKLNAVVASPAFAPWSQGVPLDLDTLLAPKKRGPIHVFTTAHLDEAQRTFFLATLLNAMVAWSRRQPGTGDLRALLYLDEVYGTLPPHPANPPTKRPVLTLMKQARAVGVGVVVATQNPVDLDYKALSNAGTWLVGRLQTEQDRERVLDGLAGAGGNFDRQTVSGWLAQLPGRCFVHRDAGEAEPVILHSRWAISYLRGPLTRGEIAKLPQPDISKVSQPVSSAGGAAAEPPEGVRSEPPPSPEGLKVRFLPPGAAAAIADLLGDLDVPIPDDGKRVWVPAAWARLDLRFDEGTTFAMDQTVQRLILPLGANPEGAHRVDLDPDRFIEDAPAGWYLDLPDEVDEAREAAALEKAVINDVHRTTTTTLFRNKALKLTSEPGEDRAAFDARARKAADALLEEDLRVLRDRADDKVDRLQDRLERKQLALQEAQVGVRAQQTQEVVNVGEMVFGMFFGGRKKSVSTAVTRRRQTLKAGSRVDALQAEVAQLQDEAAELQQELAQDMARLTAEAAAHLGDVEVVEVGLEKNDIQLRDFVLLWVPVG